MLRMLRWLVPLAIALASCSTFEVQQKRIFLRYLPESDAIDVVLVSEGLQANGDASAIRGAAERVQRMRKGRRDFIVWDLIEIDVDGQVEEQRTHPIAESDPDARMVKAWLDYSANVSTQGTRALLDGTQGGRLCLLQRIHLAQAQRFLSLFDDSMNDSVPDHGDEDDDPTFNKPARERAEARGSWAHFEGGALVVSIPMDAQGAAATLRKWLQDAASPHREDRSEGELLESLSALQISAGEMKLTFAPAADGWIAFTLTGREEYADDLELELGRLEPLAAGELSAEIARLKAQP